MSESAELELWSATRAHLIADSPVFAIIGKRIYDQPPPVKERVFPYLSLGRMSFYPADATCSDAGQFIMQLDGWTRGNGGRGEVGFPQAYRLNHAVHKALHGATLTLADNAFLQLRHTGGDTTRDLDGLTSHSIMLFESYIEIR